ncbi:MAG TPA: hypothetical protein VGD17_03085 [Chitinophagaceae bacterium]
MNSLFSYSRAAIGLISYLIFATLLFYTENANSQTLARDNVLSKSPTNRNLPAGPAVYGVFEGRPPCREIAKQLRLNVSGDCIKIKYRLTLYKDASSGKPTTYSMLGNFCRGQQRDQSCEGTWEIIKGRPSDPDAVIFKLIAGKQGPEFFLLQGDENVLFILDENKNFRTGDSYLSYTLNRVELVRMAGSK